MGCAGSSHSSVESSAVKRETMSAAERAMKAALLIQRWYRRYLARQEIKRRCSWTIFQSLEYAGEQNQIKLYNFFLDLITHLSTAKPTVAAIVSSPHQSLRGRPQEITAIEEEDKELWETTNPECLAVEIGYHGPTLQVPITANHLTSLIEHFKNRKLLHAKYVLLILHEARKVLRLKPNFNNVSTALSQQITVCGDLHGKLDDLLTIFYKNGLPARHNPYIFNGDFVDRGFQSVEVFMVLLVCLVLSPDAVFLNRGNHEDFSVNVRYGFVKEIMFKYTKEATRIIQLMEDVYSWLPLGSIIDNKVFVVHGGVSSETDLKRISGFNRHQFMTILRPPMLQGKLVTSASDWKQVVDLLWSDPRPNKGCTPNGLRGGGSFFGPDVTELFLQKHNFQRIIRSHECKIDGYEYTHQEKVLTIFSASNYYDIGSNRGAFVRLMGKELEPCMVMFISSPSTKNVTLQQKGSYFEHSALKELKEHIFSNKSLLLEKFQKIDTTDMGKVSLSDWCAVMESTICLRLPWRLLCSKITSCGDGNVEYKLSLEEFTITNNFTQQDGPSVLEALYRNKETLETIFRIMDKDGSGLISMQEFTDACDLLSQHIHTSFPPNYVQDLAKSIDMNKDGFIDFNEFLEAFRLVDRRHTPLTTKKSLDLTVDTSVVTGDQKNGCNGVFQK